MTITTVGFGDKIPLTTLGRVITLGMIVSGIIFVPWQIKNLLAHFLTTREKTFRLCEGCELKYHENDARYCKQCGESLSQTETSSDASTGSV